jgi:uncharacterized protein (DUF2336 family)
VGGEVGAAVAEAAARAGEDQLRADAVRRRREQPLAVERVQPGERAEAARARRLDRGPQPVDDRAGGRQRDPRGGVAVVRAPQGQESTTGVGYSKRSP